MTETERLLEKIARAWADHEAVDWTAAARDAPLTAEQLEQLRSLDTVTRALRQVQYAHGTTQPARAAPLFRWGALDVQERLASGSQGEIYRAWDPLLAQAVALKLARGGSDHAPSLTQQLQEVRGLANVRHPHVLSIYGAAEHDGRFGIWTELIDGVTLEQGLTDRGPFAIDDALAIGRDVAHALNAVHARGLIHGDVKPTNVMRERGGRIVLADFGACRTQRDAPAPASISGTLHYLPPEALHGGVAAAQGDVYALGVLLYRLVSGRYPYRADTLEELIAAQANGAPPALSSLRADVPEALSQLLARVIAPDPDARLVQLGALIEALADIARARHPRNPGQRARAGVALAAAAALLAVAAFAVWKLSAPPAPGNPVLAFGRDSEGQLLALPAGAILHPGDLLALTLTLPQSSFVYILNEDSGGRLSVLYPLADLDRGNPLPAGALELPGRLHGLPFRWRVSSSAAREEFLVVVAPGAVDDIERALARAVTAAQPAADEQRGVGALQAQAHALPLFVGSHLAALVAQLAKRPDIGQLQLRRFEFAQDD